MRRRPSIFTTKWFRLILGVGGVAILALALGPLVTGWLRGGQGAPAPRVPRTAPVALRVPEPARTDPAPAVAAPQPVPKPAVPQPAPGLAAATATPPSPAATPAPTQPATQDVPTTSGTSGEPTAGRPVFRVQLGAFLDHRNADRLTERLRGEGVDVANSVIDESRTMYRVLATPADDDGYKALVQRLRELGFTPELTGDAAAVTQPVPLAAAVEMSRRLREQGIRVRLEKRASSAAFRVVRAGAYGSAEEAERARAELASRGYDGIVIREH
jgi:cell division protein FtsN